MSEREKYLPIEGQCFSSVIIFIVPYMADSLVIVRRKNQRMQYLLKN